ncbi:MAG: polysaccharide biosynthesis tyrosine autokinase [Armatimonadota bacterium]|nr:polysaccharide biosynthesis tyrosine autokinase [bacterium]MDW8320578.1 polysaccharide biosynthesis tyrosine autokinase [Armatimonadota bacterium]
MEFWRHYMTLKRRWRIIALVVVLCAGAVLVWSRTTPQQYEAVAVLREQRPVGEMATEIYPVRALMNDPVLRLQNLAQIVSSNTVISKTVDDLQFIRPGVLQGDTPMERMMNFASKVRVEPIPNTEFLRVRLRDAEPQNALTAVSILVAKATERYNELTQGTVRSERERIENELLPAAKADLDAKRKALADYKLANRISGDLAFQTQVLVQRAAQYRANLDQATVEMEEARARRIAAEQELKSQYAKNEYEEMQRVMATNPVLEQLRIDLARAQASLQKELQTKAERHPDVVALKAQVAEIESRMRLESEQILNSQTRSRNPIRDAALQAYITARVAEEAAAKRAQAYAEPLRRALAELADMPRKEAGVARLELAARTAEQTYNLYLQKLDEARAKERGAQTATLVLLDPPQIFIVPKQTWLRVALALLLSLILASSVVLLLGQLDTSVRTPEEAERLLKLPVFAVIPQMKPSELNHLGQQNGFTSVGALYQILSTNLWYASRQMHGSAVVIASAEPGAGRSTTAANLAITLARDGARVLLVDGDMRQPTLHTRFGVDNSQGLANVLAGQKEIQEVAVPTMIDGLILIPAGSAADNPVRLLRSPAMEQFVERTTRLADFVIFDSPAGVVFADSTLIAAHVKNVIIVHAAGKPSRGAEAEFHARLEQVGANLIGAVLNKVRPEDSRGAYYYKRAYRELALHQSSARALPRG